MESKYEEIRNLMFKLSHLGVWNFSEDGGFFIGKAPHRGIRAWQNKIYPKISMTEIEIMENEMHRQIAPSYIRFLTSFSNGLDIFNDTLGLYGYRYSFRRDETHNQQPYNLVWLNRFQRPLNITVDMFFIGEYNWDHSFLYVTPDQKVHFCHREDATSLFTWDSIEDMLLSEIKRIYTLLMTEVWRLTRNIQLPL
ncbi:SMI1/KNR4 family protein [Duncaniella dubosii]|uniref:SMI1/KNR4 family protein n=1 Tax=Duncaniella dubosii TaxID=2518971 RepID=A0A4P7W245_9BACT|nr:SMI1/KNR4 family protein [Duncaniella dubosii]QCD41440.1 SMI1/KNR4 family protein [Duncaniella dubosii]